MMRRHTVMISSTALDLKEHREQVRVGCVRAGYSPDDMMEHLTAMDADAVKASLAMVEHADVYICILAYRYGTVPKGHEISITEMEYDHAEKIGKPRLVFFIDKSHPVTIADVETGVGADRLSKFKERIGEERVAAHFKSPADLRGHVVEALSALQKVLALLEGNGESTGAPPAVVLHRHSDIPAAPTAYIAHPYTLMQARQLVGRREELRQLTDWITDPGSTNNARLFALVAIGGMGKSALAWTWFRHIAPEEMRPLAGRLWWSFYESDASFDAFLTRALAYVAGQHEEDLRKLPWDERANQLLSRLNSEPHLLVLDGLERTLIAYARLDAARLADDDLDEQTSNRVAGAIGLPKSAAQSFVGQHSLRRTADPRAGTFLRKLAQVERSRVLITTRLYPSELQLPTGDSSPGSFASFLGGLSDDDALGLWRALRVSGSRNELMPIFHSVESHPLLIQALASEVAGYREAPGDFTQWRSDHSSFNPAGLPLVQSRTHILAYALNGLSDALRAILTTIVGFRMPAAYDTLKVLLIGADRQCADIKALDQALTELEDRGLIGWDREANRYDAHPIVRSVVWSLARQEDQQAVLRALEAYFEPIAAADSDDIESLADVAPAVERYNTLIGLGRFDDAFKLFGARLRHPMHHRLSAHRERIEMLEPLFPNGDDNLPALTGPRLQGDAQNALAVSYFSCGQLSRAAALYGSSAALQRSAGGIAAGTTQTINQGEALHVSGVLRKAEQLFRSSAVEVRKSASPWQAVALSEIGNLWSTRGEYELAMATLSSAAALLSRHPHDELTQSRIVGLKARTAALAGNFAGALDLANEAWILAAGLRFARDFLQANFWQGKAMLGLGNLPAADEHLHNTVTRARAVNLVEFELPALIALAQLSLAQNRLDEARARLTDVWEVAERGPFRLELADAYNTLAAIARADGDFVAATQAATKAYQNAWCDGPPFAYSRGLETAADHLSALGANEPKLPRFDSSLYEPMADLQSI